MNILDFSIIFAKAIFGVAFCLGLVPILVWLERKFSAFIQDRVGPNRASVYSFRLAGMFHIIADVIKLFFKEDIDPKNVNKFYFYLGPLLIGAVALMTFATIPFADTLKLGHKVINMQILNIDAGILWFLAISSFSVYGIILAAWGSNNKFSFLGGLRSSAQMLSYEIPMGLSIIGILMVFGTVHLNDIVIQQGNLIWGFIPMWGIFVQPISGLILIVCAFAETNRTPFDLVEGESELVGGYHTEYGSMKFGMLFMSEYISMVVIASVVVTLFFGGWQIPYLPTNKILENSSFLIQAFSIISAIICFIASYILYKYHVSFMGKWKDIRDYEGLIFSILFIFIALFFIASFLIVHFVTMPLWVAPIFAVLIQIGAFAVKVALFCALFVWVRWTLPRFRYDQLLSLSWKSLLPLSLLNIFVTGLVILLLK